MEAICKLSQKKTVWPCAASACPLFGDCIAEYQGAQGDLCRNYVIVANRHRTWPGGSLLFWGRHTEDHEERSFGGYTSRFNQCEKYTRAELEKWRKGDKKHYPFFDELDIGSPAEFGEYDEVLCTLEQLQSIGFSVWTVVCTP